VAINGLRARPGPTTIPVGAKGYRQLQAWACPLGPVRAFGIQGTGSYGAGLPRFLRAQGQTVLEVNRPDRQLRRQQGRSDPVDHCSAECVGIHAALRATRFEALEPLRQGVRRRFGAFAKGLARGLALRHDHGSQSMADDFQKELRFLGIASSPAFVRAPEGNGCAERFIRTLKENLLWVRSFDSVEDLRAARLAFRETYNTTWLIERHGLRPPSAVRREPLQTPALAA
jgi:transposase InsO family protein